MVGMNALDSPDIALMVLMRLSNRVGEQFAGVRVGSLARFSLH